MTYSYRTLKSGRMTVAVMLACMAMLTACGGGGDGPVADAPTPAPVMTAATVSETVSSNLTADANGPAAATSSDAALPGDPGTVEMLASDTSTAPSSTANDADAPGDPAPSTV
jgi:hypothetical protein